MPSTALQPTHAPADRTRLRAKFAVLGVLALATSVALPAGISGAATTVDLGTAESFGILGASAVTNTGPTTVWGDLGVHPLDAVTGFDVPGGPGTVAGTIHRGDATAGEAQAGARTAYNALTQPCDADLTGQDLGLQPTLTPGVYCFSSSAQLTGALTLDAEGDPDAVFIFRVATALTTASDSSVVFTDDFATCNVFWQIGSAATLGTDTDFVGTLIADTEAITANTGATVVGRLLALTAAVTLDSNVITQPLCPAAVIPPIVVPPIDVPPADDTPVDDTPVDDTPVDDTPVDDEDDATPVGGSPSDGTPGDDSGGEALGGGPAAPGTTPGGPSVPGLTTGGPSVPGLTGGPGVPDSPRPPLPYTGSNMMVGVVGALAVLVGAGLVLMTDRTKRAGGARPTSAGPAAPSAR